MINFLKKSNLIGVISFLIVLFAMPLGHAAMLIMENMMEPKFLFIGALLMGFMGIALTVWGVYIKNDTNSTILGLLGSLLLWTGWVEFCYVYYAHRYDVSPLIENGKIVTKPEYLIMPSSVGLWSIIMLLYVFWKRTKCSFFVAIQKFLGINKQIIGNTDKRGSSSIVTFLEMNILLWTSYLVLLFAYDDRIFGDHHPVTYIIAFGSLFWSVWLFLRLIKIKDIGYAIRYSIPVVIIFWTFIEILGRWNFFEEIWIHPFQYKLEICLMIFVFVALIVTMILANRRKKVEQSK